MRQTDRQQDIQTYRQTNRQTNRQIEIQTNKQTDSHTDRQTDRVTNRRTDRQTVIQTEWQPGRQTVIQTEWQPDSQTETNKNRLMNEENLYSVVEVRGPFQLVIFIQNNPTMAEEKNIIAKKTNYVCFLMFRMQIYFINFKIGPRVVVQKSNKNSSYAFLDFWI